MDGCAKQMQDFHHSDEPKVNNGISTLRIILNLHLIYVQLYNKHRPTYFYLFFYFYDLFLNPVKWFLDLDLQLFRNV